jgi:hypothetical protein
MKGSRNGRRNALSLISIFDPRKLKKNRPEPWCDEITTQYLF